MGVTYNPDDFKRLARKAAGMFANFADDVKLAGEVGAEAIVRTTLAGIGANDEAFAEYSAAYRELIDSVGGKPQQTVNLRGLFYHAGQERVKFKSEKQRQRFREGRRAYVNLRFAQRNKAKAKIFAAVRGFGKPATRLRVAAFTARTALTRPARGITDPLSEMSLDLIKVDATDKRLVLEYTPRKKPYMIYHQKGEGKNPRREWFSIQKQAVIGAMMHVMAECMAARALQFNLSSGDAIKSGRAFAGDAIRKRATGNLPGA
jgi:hypothetical protein